MAQVCQRFEATEGEVAGTETPLQPSCLERCSPYLPRGPHLAPGPLPLRTSVPPALTPRAQRVRLRRPHSFPVTQCVRLTVTVRDKEVNSGRNTPLSSL